MKMTDMNVSRGKKVIKVKKKGVEASKEQQSSAKVQKISSSSAPRFVATPSLGVTVDVVPPSTAVSGALVSAGIRKPGSDQLLPLTSGVPAQGHGKQKGLMVPPKTSSLPAPPSMWDDYSIPPMNVSRSVSTHAPDHFCPEWQIGINDQAMYPDVARNLCRGVVLPRDLQHSKCKPPERLIDDLLCSQVAVNTSMADLVDRFNTLVQRDKERKKQLKKTENLISKANKARQVAEFNLKEANIRNESLRTAVDEAEKKAAETEVKLQNEVAYVRMTAANDYRESKEFEEDLVELSRPIYKFGYTKAMQKVKELHPELAEELNLDDDAHYDSEIEDLAELCLQGIKAGQKVKGVSDAFYAKRQAENMAEEAVEGHTTEHPELG